MQVFLELFILCIYLVQLLCIFLNESIKELRQKYSFIHSSLQYRNTIWLLQVFCFVFDLRFIIFVLWVCTFLIQFRSNFQKWKGYFGCYFFIFSVTWQFKLNCTVISASVPFNCVTLSGRAISQSFKDISTLKFSIFANTCHHSLPVWSWARYLSSFYLCFLTYLRITSRKISLGVW